MSKSINFQLNFSSNKPNTSTQAFWVDDKQVSEMEYYGIDENTTLEDIGSEPFNYKDFNEWKIKKQLILDNM
jgi:hypothetical protein